MAITQPSDLLMTLTFKHRQASQGHDTQIYNTQRHKQTNDVTDCFTHWAANAVGNQAASCDSQ